MAEIGEVDGRLDRLLEGASCSLNDRLEIFQHPSRLGLDSPLHEFPRGRVQADLSRREEKPVRLDPLHVGPHRLGGLLCRHHPSPH